MKGSDAGDWPANTVHLGRFTRKHANSIAGNTAQLARLTAAGYPANLFEVNPATGGSNANLTTNQGGSTYHSMQIEITQRMSSTGLLAGVSYTWSHSLSTGNILTLRDMDGVTFPSAFDQRLGLAQFAYAQPQNDSLRAAEK